MSIRDLRAYLAVAILLAGCLMAATPAVAATLYIGTDTEEFEGLPNSFLLIATVNGPNLVSETMLTLGFPLNGIGDGPGFLYAGDPNTNTLRYVDPTTGLQVLPSVTAGFANFCCNEEMQVYNNTLYRDHWSDNIQAIDPATGAVLQTYAQPQVVGLAQVGAALWITHWSEQQVGTWVPATNTFVPVFTTPQLAGALAYDPSAQILWVGQLGGMVIPYDLLGNPLGSGFNALAPIQAQFPNSALDTIDGLTFKGESQQTAVPEPATLTLFGTGLALAAARRRRKAGAKV